MFIRFFQQQSASQHIAQKAVVHTHYSSDSDLQAKESSFTSKMTQLDQPSVAVHFGASPSGSRYERQHFTRRKVVISTYHPSVKEKLINEQKKEAVAAKVSEARAGTEPSVARRIARKKSAVLHNSKASSAAAQLAQLERERASVLSKKAAVLKKKEEAEALKASLSAIKEDRSRRIALHRPFYDYHSGQLVDYPLWKKDAHREKALARKDSRIWHQGKLTRLRQDERDHLVGSVKAQQEANEWVDEADYLAEKAKRLRLSAEMDEARRHDPPPRRYTEPANSQRNPRNQAGPSRTQQRSKTFPSSPRDSYTPFHSSPFHSMPKRQYPAFPEGTDTEVRPEDSISNSGVNNRKSKSHRYTQQQANYTQYRPSYAKRPPSVIEEEDEDFAADARKRTAPEAPKANPKFRKETNIPKADKSRKQDFHSSWKHPFSSKRKTSHFSNSNHDSNDASSVASFAHSIFKGSRQVHHAVLTDEERAKLRQQIKDEIESCQTINQLKAAKQKIKQLQIKNSLMDVQAQAGTLTETEKQELEKNKSVFFAVNRAYMKKETMFAAEIIGLPSLMEMPKTRYGKTAQKCDFEKRYAAYLKSNPPLSIKEREKFAEQKKELSESQKESLFVESVRAHVFEYKGWAK